RELHERANQVAHYLRKKGAGPESLVGISLERSLHLPVAVLGVIKSGAAFVPLDPSYPRERLNVMIEDSQMPLIVTQQKVAVTLPEHQAEIIDLEADWALIAQEPTTAPVHEVQPHDLAYMIYTSGSTGRPKAVMIEHGNFAHTLRISQENFHFAPEDVTSCIASEAFDISYFELLNPLISGGTAVIFTREQVLDIPRLIDDLGACTMSYWVPSLARQIVKTMREQQIPASRLARMKNIYTGGDAVPIDLLQDLVEVLPHVTIVVLYGPTEGTIICTEHSVRSGSVIERPLIGKSLGNANLRLYDAHEQPVPIGVPGELYIGGVCVGRGYYRRDDLTAEKFVTIDNQRWYRTGDLVSLTADGALDFLGRIDNQVKIRGYRIELGEVEAAVLQHPAVQEGIVIVREDVPGDKRLVAYVVPAPEQDVTAKDLQNFLKEKLPNFMVPSAVVTLEKMPLNANQKIDRKALAAPVSYTVERDGTYIAPRNKIEEQVAAIMEETLVLTQVGVEDSFFDLGGHSLLATQVISRIVEVLGVKVPVRTFFESPTVAGLAAFIEHASSNEDSASSAQAVAILPVARDGQLPASFAQQRLWFAEQMESNTAMYNMYEVVRLTGKLDRAALLRSLNEITRRHEALRTTFAEVEGLPVQVIQPFAPLEMPLIDLQGYAEEVREAEAIRIAEGEAQRPFDLKKDLLIRPSLLKLGEEKHILLVSTHHIANDGWSTGVFYRELKALYEAFTSGQPSPLPELPIQYADFAAWQRKYMQGDALETQLSYWREQLGGELPVMQLPSDRPRPNKPVCRGDFYSVQVPQPLADELKRLSQRMGASLYMTLLAGFETLMYRYSGQEDFLIGSPIANRNYREIEGLIGFFVNMLTLRTDL
ncbi:MAG: amino acid adenylation domain-containing protein, partial [Tumebacillaceae bacterium]